MSASPWYRSTRDASTLSPAVAQRALEWLVELQADAVAPETVREWTCWRAAHPDHERAWLRIESVRGTLQPLVCPASAAIAHAALSAPAAPHRRRALKAMGVLALAGGATWSAGQYTPWREWTSDHRTRVGERRNLILPDGTRLALNTDSAIDVRFSAAERRVALIAGEILVATAHEARPFLVETGHGTARALGTEYTVRLLDASTEVGVYQGAVQIRPRDDAGHGLTLQAGLRANYSSHGVDAPSPAEENRLAWKDGFIVARAMRLDDFIAELGRYCRDSLSCDPAVAGMRLSGSFPVNDIDKVLAALRATLDIRVEAHTRLWGGRRLRLIPGPDAARA
ncbi:FecR domain-containing protein [Achromobacter arsenitoxydans]|uniref:Fe2+-dicitrate sensor membrane protein n=1 Tax=Achromobacter arsenitoxydans SY8 TaxID=477184 RepID=H0F5F4_9BURK|nr:FecR domain-containing protein [Achromobacter arsenitoxydans]EHK66468.1 Fe2+-dicitrate sensor membrane protein [Achromobacter arsenitoxydans SY8]